MDCDYDKLVFIEFYELLCRLGEMVHAGSEMKHLACQDKLSNLLKLVLPWVNVTFNASD